VDVMTRTVSHVPVEIFDGTRLPFGDRAFDAAMMVDVLHHAEHQYELLAEMSRVVKRTFVIKDHVVRGALARPTLAFMDWVGNARYGVALPYAYWSDEQWSGAFGSLGFVARERRESLGLYAWPASLLFERGLHFVARFDRTA
jgi:SAM-dependent methyltransferase